ncbi:MAG: hypothetical protein CYPHOPRED_002274 [Cyphobasidiales sp. Tagirdzhanova-0007]|nr:MAG: hypothetical protein CYPHOPRED_002274 [Cyphobasidiales sp. Tagirdzhanova-0007]
MDKKLRRISKEDACNSTSSVTEVIYGNNPAAAAFPLVVIILHELSHVFVIQDGLRGKKRLLFRDRISKLSDIEPEAKRAKLEQKQEALSNHVQFSQSVSQELQSSDQVDRTVRQHGSSWLHVKASKAAYHISPPPIEDSYNPVDCEQPLTQKLEPQGRTGQV